MAIRNGESVSEFFADLGVYIYYDAGELYHIFKYLDIPEQGCESGSYPGAAPTTFGNWYHFLHDHVSHCRHINSKPEEYLLPNPMHAEHLEDQLAELLHNSKLFGMSLAIKVSSKLERSARSNLWHVNNLKLSLPFIYCNIQETTTKGPLLILFIKAGNFPVQNQLLESESNSFRRTRP